MSNIVDTRVVEMMFKNSEFERGIKSTLDSLDKLKKGLKLDGVSSGLDNIGKSASRFNLGSIANSLQTISSRFTTLGVIGTAALASIASQAAMTGLALVKNLTLGPIQAGLREYETNLNSIQTILANTGLEGQKGLDRVNKALSDLNEYSDQTIYNFSEMARNIGTFTAAGVDLDTSTAAIKGIANLAAISGSNSQQASTAMYQLSQAMAAGKATLVDWNSVVNAGMGGKVFQEALKETARVQGVAIDDIIKKNGSFRDSLQEGWLTTEVLTGTLAKFTGDMTAQQLKALGYTEKQIAAILKMGKTAQDAATKVKTISQLISTLQEAAGSGWSRTFQLLFGDFEEARTLFTNVNNVLGGFIQRSAEARNKVIGDWKALGGRKVLIEGISQAFDNLMSVLTPIKQAFRDIFPAATGKDLYNLTVSFRNLMESLKPGQETIENLRRTFRGLFAIFSIAISVIKGVATTIATVFDAFSGGSGSILEFTGDIGDWLVALDQAIKKGEGFKEFFVDLGRILSVPITFLKIVIGLIKDLVGGLDDLDFSALDDVGERFAPIGRMGGIVSKAWTAVGKVLEGVYDIFNSLTDKFADFFEGFTTALAETFSGADYNQVLDAVNTGLLAGLVLLFRKFLSGGINIDLGGGVLSQISEAFSGLTGVLGAMQTQLKANALLKIAGAVALLTASIVAMSLIDSKKLSYALGGLAVAFTQLLVAMGVIDKITSSTGFLKMPFLTTAMISLALAINLLALAAKQLSDLSWEELAKGLTGTAALLTSLALYTRFSAANSVSGIGIILLATGIKILVDAVKDFEDVSWEEMSKGLVGVGALLGSLAIFTRLTAAAKGGVLQGAGLVLLAYGIKVLAEAMDDLGQLSWIEIARGLTAMAGGLVLMGAALKLVPPSSIFSAAAIFVVASSLSMIGEAIEKMGNISWNEIGRGLTSMAGALTLISVALALLPPSTLFSAAAIFVVASSLGMIGDALGQMGDMTWEEIGKGLTTLAGALTIIATALYFMQGTLAGSAAVLVMAAALRVLVPVLTSLGAMTWGEIVKGLTALAGAFVVLAVAGIALAPITPILLALGIAIGLMGVAMLAAGAGMALFGVGLTAVAASGSAAVGVLLGSVKSILTFLPEIVEELGALIMAFANAIIKATPTVVKAIITVLMSILSAITKNTPKIAQELVEMLLALLRVLTAYVPKLSKAGTDLIVAILNAIARNQTKMTTAATNVLVKFLEGISKNMPRITKAGKDLIVDFINALASEIRASGPELGDAGANLALAMVEGMMGGLNAGVGRLADKAASMAKSALDAAKRVLGISSPSKEFEKVGRFVNQGFLKGLDGNKGDINNAFKSLNAQLVTLQKNQLRQLATLEAQLRKQGSARKKDYVAINKTKAAIKELRSEYYKTRNTYALSSRFLKDEQAALGRMADRYDVLSKKIATTRERINEMYKAREEFRAGVVSQFSDLATPEDDQTARQFVDAGKKQLADVKKFTALLNKLRERGINEELYRDLLTKGTTSIPFMENLIAGGKTAIAEINKLEKDLNSAGTLLASHASGTLYNVGINAAVGLVEGLEKQRSALEKIMDNLAQRMVDSIKKTLRIKSPSRVMEEIGRSTVDGMAAGLEKYSIVVEKSARSVGNSTIEELRKTMSGISSVLLTDPDFRPTVRPVLDLTDVQRDVGGISKMFKPLDLSTTFGRAKDASAGVANNKFARDMIDADRGVAVSLTQYNNSPKSLSNAEIYRQTKNQLSTVKGALERHA